MGKGAFQELDQVEAARQVCKFSGRATSAAQVPSLLQAALQVRPGLATWHTLTSVCMLQASLTKGRLEWQT